MRIRTGHSPSPFGLAPRVVPGRVVNPKLAIIPHLPPVHFYSDGDVRAGGEVTLRSEALSNRTGLPIEIREIRFHAVVITALAAGTLIDPGGFIRVRMTADGKPLTNTFVPIWLLGRTEQEAAHVNPSFNPRAVYVWRLSRPWYLSPKTVIEAQVQNTAAVNAQLRVGVGLAGNYAAVRRTTSSMPYAASFVSKPFSYTGTDFDESSERDLVNITSRTLIVERIIGRVTSGRATGGASVASFTDKDNVGVDRATTMRIFNSKNLPIIRDYSNVRTIFGESRSIDIEHTMDPGEFLRVGVKNVAGPTLTTPFTTYTSQAHVSIVGRREEAL